MTEKHTLYWEREKEDRVIEKRKLRKDHYAGHPFTTAALVTRTERSMAMIQRWM